MNKDKPAYHISSDLIIKFKNFLLCRIFNINYDHNSSFLPHVSLSCHASHASNHTDHTGQSYTFDKYFNFTPSISLECIRSWDDIEGQEILRLCVP